MGRRRRGVGLELLGLVVGLGTFAGVVSFAVGLAPVPFLRNVEPGPLGVTFSYRLVGFEAAGASFSYAGLAVAGSNPFLSANQLSLAIQPFQFTP
jgi:hypothetical protein